MAIWVKLSGTLFTFITSVDTIIECAVVIWRVVYVRENVAGILISLKLQVNIMPRIKYILLSVVTLGGSNCLHGFIFLIPLFDQFSKQCTVEGPWKSDDIDYIYKKVIRRTGTFRW